MSPDGTENIIGNALSFRENVKAKTGLFGPLVSDVRVTKSCNKMKPTDVFSCGVFTHKISLFMGDEQAGAEPTMDEVALPIDYEPSQFSNQKK